MAEQRYYPHDYTDEVVPCDCTLAGWAEWFSRPDPDWNRPEAAKPGDTFPTQVAEIREIECVYGRWGWVWSTEVEAAVAGQSTTFYLRHNSGLGWAADNSGDTVAEALAWTDGPEVGDTAYVAAMTWAGEVELRFEIDDDGPHMVVVQQIGRA